MHKPYNSLYITLPSTLEWQNSALCGVREHRQLNNSIYYIKASGIPNGNKLIKTIRYPHLLKTVSLDNAMREVSLA